MTLVPASSHGAAAFNGGTITGGLTVAPTDNTLADLVRITAPVGFEAGSGSGKFVRVVAEDGTEAFAIYNYGAAYLRAPAGEGAMAVQIFSIDNPSTHIFMDTSLGVTIGSNTGGFNLFDAGSNLKFAASAATGGIQTSPHVSAASTLALGTAYQNTLGYDVLLCVYLSVTVNTSGVLKLGVGPTSTPTQQTLVTGITSTGLWPVPIYLPDQFYALLSVTGTITVAVDGQIAMAI